MKLTRLLGAIAVLLAVQLACLFTPPTPTAVIPPTGPTATEVPTAAVQPIGSIKHLQGGVEAGPEAALEPVNPSRDMYDDDAARVFNNGKAQLDYGYGLTLTLYNDTTTTGTRATASQQVIAKLAQGGLLGYNPPGKRTEVQIADIGTVVILGTHYFIAYDPASQTAAAFNFDGSMSYSIAGGSLVELPQRALVVFNANQVIRIYTDLLFTPEGFDGYATSSNSPLLGLAAMESEYQVPVAPPLASPDNGTVLSTAPVLQWNTVDYAQKYQIQVSNDPGFAGMAFDSTLESSQWSAPQEMPMGVYYWHVRALSTFDTPGEWSESRTFTISVPPGAPALAEPGNGQLVNEAVQFGWQGVPDAARYEIQLSFDAGFEKLAYDEQIQSTFWAPPSPLAGGPYYWRVGAINAYNTLGTWSEARTFTVNVPPAAPLLWDPGDSQYVGTDLPRFDWQPAADAARYQIQVSYYSDYSYLAFDAAVGSADWTPPSVLPMGTYFWRVRAFNIYETAGPWSTSRAFTINLPPGEPALIDPADNLVTTTGSPGFSWEAAANAARYQIQVSYYADFSKLAFDAAVGGKEWVPPYSLSAGTYYWRVQAFNIYETAGPWSGSRTLIVSLPPGVPDLYAPANNYTMPPDYVPIFSWYRVRDASYYEIQIGLDNSFQKPLYDQTVREAQWTASGTFKANYYYYWRVRAFNQYGVPGGWSQTWRVYVGYIIN